MKMFNKVFILIFVMSLFFLPQSVLAEYKATVVGDSPVCELFGGARGKCLYQNANLNSVGGYWYSLDLGDEVTVYENDTVPTNDTYRCSDYYVKVDASPADQPWIVTTGYFCHADLKSDFLTEEMKTEFRNAGFPESYWEKLAVLKTNHPKWTFYAIDTELDFNTAVLNETYGGRNVLRLSMSNNYALLSKGTDSFDYINNKYLEYDDIGGSIDGFAFKITNRVDNKEINDFFEKIKKELFEVIEQILNSESNPSSNQDSESNQIYVLSKCDGTAGNVAINNLILMDWWESNG